MKLVGQLGIATSIVVLMGIAVAGYDRLNELHASKDEHKRLEVRVSAIENETQRKAAQRAVWRYEDELLKYEGIGNMKRIKEIEDKLRKAREELEEAESK